MIFSLKSFVVIVVKKGMKIFFNNFEILILYFKKIAKKDKRMIVECNAITFVGTIIYP